MTTRRMQPEPSCTACGQPLFIDEEASRRAGSRVHACRSCARQFPAAEQGHPPAERGASIPTGSGTIRMRVVRKTAPGGMTGTLPSELPEGMTVALEVSDGPGRGGVHKLGRRMVTIGREEGEIVIPDPGISRRHASIEILDPETVILRDLSSTNGTYHNDQLIAFCKVQDGDEIRIGGTVLTVSIDLLA